MLPMGNVGEKDRPTSFHHVLWSFALQTPLGSCAKLVMHSLRNIQPVQLVVQQKRQAAVVLAGVADDASSGIQYSLKLVGDGLRRHSETGVAVVHARRHEGANM